MPNDFINLGNSVIAQQLFSANIYFRENTSYFDGQASLMPMLHTWSLAVEEQFYLIYPFLLIFCWRKSKKTTVVTFSTIAVASLCLSQWTLVPYPAATFYLLPTRAWEFLLGGLICFLPEPKYISNLMRGQISIICFLALIATALWYTPATQFPGLSATIPCGTTGLIIYLHSYGTTFIKRMLSARILVFTGLISYSLYLWHWPILVFIRYRIGETIPYHISIGALFFSFTIACLSWKFIEVPIRKGHFLTRKANLIGTTTAAMGILIFSGWMIRQDGFKWRFKEKVLNVISTPYAGLNHGATGNRKSGWILPKIGEPQSSPSFLLWGDSFAKCISELCDTVAKKHGHSGFDAGKGGTPPLPGTWTKTEPSLEAQEYNEYVLNYAVHHQIKHLILFAAWDLHTRGLSFLRDRYTTELFEAFKNGFHRLLAKAEAHQIQITVILQPPYQHVDVPTVLGRHIVNGSSNVCYGIHKEDHDTFQLQSRQFFESLKSRIEIINPLETYFAKNDRSIIGKADRPFYSDRGHPSVDGAQYFLEAVLATLFAGGDISPLH